jgi:hypothetical protein
VGVHAADEDLPGFDHVVRCDRCGAIGDDDLGELAGERVDQPRLALGLVEGGGSASGVKRWPVSSVCCW